MEILQLSGSIFAGLFFMNFIGITKSRTIRCVGFTASIEQDRQCNCNVTLRRVFLTIVVI